MNEALKRICVSPELSITKAVKVLNDGHRRIVLVVDTDVKLLGVVGDSDIRRAILQGTSFDLAVKEIMVNEPVVAPAHMAAEDILSLMQSTTCHEIPIIDELGMVVDLKTIDSLMSSNRVSNQVVIMAGGLGKRLRPITDTLPKPLVSVGAKPILFTLLDQLILSGLHNIWLTLNHQGEMIEEAVRAMPQYRRTVRFIYEEKRMGTAGSLSKLEAKPTEPFLVLNADLLTKVDFKAMLHFHDVEANRATVAVKEEQYEIPYGVLHLDGAKVRDIEEKPVHKLFVNAGIYVLDPLFVDLVPKDSYLDMPDLLKVGIAKGYEVGSFPVHEYWLDIGSHDELKKAEKEIDDSFQI